MTKSAKTKCLIVDDEPLAIEIIENYLDRLEDFEIVATCKNALEAFAILEKERIDLLFLDIQMPQLTGIEFVRALQNPPKVIFTTAYSDYAVESYELAILDYLVKPISFDRFFKAITKYKAAAPKVTQTKELANTTNSSIYVQVNKKKHRVQLKDILYIESVKDYVRLHFEDKNLVIKTTLTDFEKELPSNQFLRVHRSYIVNLTQVTAHTSKDIEIGRIEIPIGVSYKQQVSAGLS